MKFPSGDGPSLSFSPFLIIPCCNRPWIKTSLESVLQNWSILNSTGPFLAFKSTILTGSKFKKFVIKDKPDPLTEEVKKIGTSLWSMLKFFDMFEIFDSELIKIGMKSNGRSPRTFSTFENWSEVYILLCLSIRTCLIFRFMAVLAIETNYALKIEKNR